MLLPPPLLLLLLLLLSPQLQIMLMSLYTLSIMLEDPFDTGAQAAPDTLSMTEFMHTLAYVSQQHQSTTVCIGLHSGCSFLRASQPSMLLYQARFGTLYGVLWASICRAMACCMAHHDDL
jgi:hypothetical protein